MKYKYYLTVLLVMLMAVSACVSDGHTIFKKVQDRLIGNVVFNEEGTYFVDNRVDYLLSEIEKVGKVVDPNAPTDGISYLNVQKIDFLANNLQKWNFVRGECRYSYIVEKKERVWVMKSWQYESSSEYCISSPRPFLFR